MESLKKGQRKRKSAGIGDIFEVNDKDLSPEPEESHTEEPEAKVLKTRNSDVSESRQNGVEHNPKTEDVNFRSDLCDKPNELHDIKNENDQNCDIDSENIGNDLGLSTMPPNLNDNALEEGEVNDTIITIDETLLSPGGLSPSITIKFSDKFIADIYKSKFLTFLNSFIELETQNLDNTTLSIFRNNAIDSKECIVLEDTPCKSAIKRTDDNSKLEEELAKELPLTPKNESPKKKKKKKKQKELFVLDTNPGADNQNSLPTKYSTKFLINDENQEDPKVNRIGAVNCFNCGQNHSLKDCSQALNYNKINSNRQKFMQKSKTTRYHLEEEQKYSHLQPGKLSPALRKALGLKKHQMPTYIYQMRRLGYPPGWLEEAKVVESELAMFDIDGNNVKNTNSKKIRGLDPDKIINYPGFNVPFEKDFKDEYKHYRVPPYSEDFCKEKMIDFFKKQCLQDEDDFETQDMDLDITDDLVVIDTTEECAEVKTIQNKTLDSVIVSDPKTVSSPSLNDLEEQKDTLLAELKKREETIPWDYTSEDTATSSNGDQKLMTEKLSEKQVEGNEDSKNADENKDPTKPDTEVVTDSNCQVVQTSSEMKSGESDKYRNTSSPITVNNGANSVKHTSFGTPIIKSSTPYNRLPNPDNFSVGVSPVIDFENLPNSTGKYEQMTGILQKVRETLKKNQPKTKT